MSSVSPTLRELCTLCATPGDEGAVFGYLAARWRRQGLDVRRLGPYAVVAEPSVRLKSDTVLLTAHADAPGFIAAADSDGTEGEVLALGGISPDEEAPLCLLREGHLLEGFTLIPPEADADWDRRRPLRVRSAAPGIPLRKGDRLCWAPRWETRDGLVVTPFLDNRAGCALIADWYDRFARLLPEYNVMLAVTAMEEVNGFGASVLARHVSPDAVIALDATYTNGKQGVTLGGGPVVTLSDASVLLSPALRDRLLACGVPLQTEVYNYSGTDAKAFPSQGLSVPVVPLLIPTLGNHSPAETASLADLDAWPEAVAAVTRTLFSRPLTDEPA